MANRDSIKVVCRIRPENEIEKKGSYRRCVEHDEKRIEINVNDFLVQYNLTALGHPGIESKRCSWKPQVFV